MPIASTKKVQSFIQGIINGQTFIESGLSILLDSPDREQKFDGWLLINKGISLLMLMKAAYLTHAPSLVDSNLIQGQINSFNTYYADLVQAQADAGVSGGYVVFRDAINQAQTDHASIITTIKSKDVPSHGVRSLD